MYKKDSAVIYFVWIFTVTCRQRVAPPVVLLAHQRLLVAEPVAGITTEGNCGADGEILPIADPVDRNTRVQARVAVHCDAWDKRLEMR